MYNFDKRYVELVAVPYNLCKFNINIVSAACATFSLLFI